MALSQLMHFVNCSSCVVSGSSGLFVLGSSKNNYQLQTQSVVIELLINQYAVFVVPFLVIFVLIDF